MEPSDIKRICFVCQAGPLEPKAVLLAASLRVHFPHQIELIAAHPKRVGLLHHRTERALSALDVVTRPINNPLREDYPIAHKLAAMTLLSGPKLGVFLDTDTLAMGPPEPLPDRVSAVPATGNHFALHEWRYAYLAFGLELPASAAAVPQRSGDQAAPYFNTGMIAVPGHFAEALAACWVDTAARLEADLNVPKRRFLDQMSLPIAAVRLGNGIEPLDPRWNFPGWAWQLAGRPTPIIFHYQGPARLHEDAKSARAASQAANLLPSVRDALVGFGYPL